VFDADLDNGLEAVGGKGRWEHQYFFHSPFSTFDHRVIGKRRQPFVVETRLEANGIAIFRNTQTGGDVPGCRIAGSAIAIYILRVDLGSTVVVRTRTIDMNFVDLAFRQPMVGKKNMVVVVKL